MECMESAHCADGRRRICDLQAHAARCVECLEHGDCTKGSGNTGWCDKGECRLCESDQDCLDAYLGKRCWGGMCVPCLVDGDCLQGAGNTGRCGFTEGVGYACDGCREATECLTAGLGRACRTDLGVMEARRKVCVACTRDSHCAAGEGDTGRCYENQCVGCQGVGECDAAFGTGTMECAP